MVASKAELVLLKIGDGGSPQEQFLTLGGLKTTRMMVNRQVLAATDATSQGWRRVLQEAGTAFVRLQGAGLFANSVAEDRLHMQAMTGASANYELYFGNGGKMTGAFIASSYERSGKVGDLESFSVTLESVDAVDYVVM